MRISKDLIEMYQAKKEMSTKALAKASGLARQNISIIKSRGSCNPDTAAKLAKGLGVEIEAIMIQGEE